MAIDFLTRDGAIRSCHCGYRFFITTYEQMELYENEHQSAHRKCKCCGHKQSFSLDRLRGVRDTQLARITVTKTEQDL